MWPGGGGRTSHSQLQSRPPSLEGVAFGAHILVYCLPATSCHRKQPYVLTVSSHDNMTSSRTGLGLLTPSLSCWEAGSWQS